MGRFPRREARWLLGWAVLTVFLPHRGLAQSHSGFPVDIVAGPLPQVVMAGGRAHLLYELHVTNVAPIPIEVVALDVFGDDGTAALASYRGEALEKVLVPAENLLVSIDPIDRGDKRGQIGEGHGAVIFVDLTLDAGARVPMQLRHRFTFDIKGNAALGRTINGPVVAVVQEPTPVLHAPLQGEGWIAFNALGGYDHRRAFVPADGRMRIAQRFAIDWGRLGSDGREFHDDAKSNNNFYGYGAVVLAVADARVSDLRDGVPDNVGATARSSRVITVDSAVGNYVILDLGGGRFALYAHLQPDSLKVKLGDHVNAGQPLALLGNSGNSDAPHLHFQLTDGNSPMASEGIPYELEKFTQLGILGDESALDNGQAWQPKAQEKPIVLRGEFPIDKAVVNFQ
jgi:murein DD-endopeptidase MepM/ murein hydrolase activator NlpD